MLRPQQNKIRNVFDLSGIWEFEVKGEKRPIAVPASWNEQYQDLCYEEGPVTYRKSFYIPADFKGKRKIELIREIRREISKSFHNSLDILLYEETEFNERATVKNTLENNILKNGIILNG